MTPATRHRLLSLFGALAIVCALYACARPLLKGPPPFAKAVAIDKLYARAKAVHALDGDFRLDYEEGLGHERVSLALALQSPASLAVELSGPGGLLAAAACDGETLRYFDARRQEAYVGRATAETFARVLPLAMDPQDLVPLLLAAPLPLVHAGADDLVADHRAGLWRLDLTEPRAGLTQSFFFDPQGDLQRVRLALGKRMLYDVRYADWQVAEASSFPHVITLRNGLRPKAEITLTSRGLPALNPALDPARFTLDFPPSLVPSSL